MLPQGRHVALKGKSVFEKKPTTWDVFICHAREDKETVARPTARALEKQGASVWLDVDQLKIGHQLRHATDVALGNCDVAAVIFSRSFYQSEWALYELDGIVARSVKGELLLVPVLHEITRAEVLKWSPSLANTISRSTADFTIEQIADEIMIVMEQWRSATRLGREEKLGA